MMSIKKTNRKKNLEKQKSRASKKFTRTVRLAAGIKTMEKSKAAKSKTAKNKVSRKQKSVRATAAVPRKSQSVETVSLEPKGLGTRAGVGAGDLQDIST
jgi:hypothetical protein